MSSESSARCRRRHARVALIGGVTFGIDEPFAGGMEALVAGLAIELAGRDHDVTVFAGTGAERTVGGVRVVPLVERPFRPSPAARQDVSMPPERFMQEHHAYLCVLRRLLDEQFDVVHNHSLHYLLPASEIPGRVVHTLHSPPTPWLESAFHARRPGDAVIVSVSHSNAAHWRGLVDCVVPNGVDVDRWRPGPGDGDYVVWTGRLVPEKAPHLAIDAAREAGTTIRLAGPRHDPVYFDNEIVPRLADDAVYEGHLATAALVSLVGRATCSLVTPVWDEPYGLVVAESLACGTPVAAFDRGAIAEVIGTGSGVLCRPDSSGALAEAIHRAAVLDRAECRRWAEQRCSIVAMADRYEDVYAA